MLPLGDVWSGICRAIPDQPWQPGDDRLPILCNLGYARGNCDRFPAAEGPDAVRFTISQDQGSIVRVYYVVERDHHPVAHGPLEYSRALSGFSNSTAGQEITRQAEAYVASYLRRKDA
jgi:hypothetical protein